MERYKGYLVPIASVKAGSLLKKLADREQTTTDNIMHFATRSDPQEPKAIESLTSTEELLEALDLAIGSEGDDLEDHAHEKSEFVSTQSEPEDGGEAVATLPTKRKRRTKKELEVAATGEPALGDPEFIELTKLLPPVPKKGNFEVNTVKKSLYFFS